ncbi:MAG: polysaccharide deacetylase family protein [Dehalococcoidia bacterium]|nr:polysaccharide deacetylase family protein [Dehalococcoidia bacterium]
MTWHAAVVLVLLAGCASGGAPPAGAGPSATAQLPPLEPTSPAAAVPIESTPTIELAPARLSPTTEVARVPRPPQPAGPVEVSRGSLERRELALTFDCGGHAGPTQEILDILREANVSATFFMIGDWVRAYPDLARQIAARHEFAHHSDRHPDYPALTDEQIVADLEAGERAFIEVTGKTTRPLWRAPSGARDDRVLAAAARAGWTVHVFWTQERNARGELVTGDSGDWRPFTPEQVLANIERAADLGSGVITVSHCDSEQTRLVLRPAIEAIRARGLRIVTVSELLR